MFEARIFTTGEIVSAQDVLDGKYQENENFVDVEEDFRVSFVRRAKNNGKPYFRIYYSLEDYRKLFPDRASRYEIYLKQRHFQESKWHKDWEERFDDFCETEKTISKPNSAKYKRADAYYEKTNTCIELQHSYIDYDFEDRNEFYRELGMNVIWLYDLTHLDVKQMPDGTYRILEDNNKGFFRIAENPEKFKNCFVFIQAKDNLIYQVSELFRKEIDNDLKSTVRYFYPASINRESDFIKCIKENVFSIIRGLKKLKEIEDKKYTDLYSLWEPEYSGIIVKCKKLSFPIFIMKSPYSRGEMETDRFSIPPKIIGRSFTRKGNVIYPTKTMVGIDDTDARKPIWKYEDV